jgi:hypothetical protein
MFSHLPHQSDPLKQGAKLERKSELGPSPFDDDQAFERLEQEPCCVE